MKTYQIYFGVENKQERISLGYLQVMLSVQNIYSDFYSLNESTKYYNFKIWTTN